MVSAGRVLLMPKGEYNAATPYTMLDLVSYNGSSYVAKKSTTGNLPTNTEYWQLSAYGGSAANLAGNFATLETTDYASQEYAIDDFLVTKNSVFCKVIAAIDIGDELVLDTNIEATSVSELIQATIDYVAGLDAKDVKLQGMTAISAQTDLDDMTTPGNFYKSSTSFYVTNAPTGIASELTAIFRLTVENGSDTTDKYIQTLRTNDGKTYTRGYDGSDWSDWIEDASAASVSALDSTKQPKTLATARTIGGTSRTTVEDALGALTDSDYLANNLTTDSATKALTAAQGVALNSALSNVEDNLSHRNLLDNPFFTVNQRGVTTFNNVANNTYTVDRWKVARYVNSLQDTLNVTNDGLQNVSVGTPDNTVYINQLVDASIFDGGTYTLSALVTANKACKVQAVVMDDNNTIILSIGGADVAANTPTIIQKTGVLPKYNGTYQIRLYFNYSKINDITITARAIKLEKGSVSTLAMDTAPNYATELLKCQRYFVRFQWCSLGWVKCMTANQWSLLVNVPTVMRDDPTVSYSGSMGVGVTDTDYRIIPISSMATFNEAGIPLTIGINVTGGTATVGEFGRAYINGIGNYIDLSADL